MSSGIDSAGFELPLPWAMEEHHLAWQKTMNAFAEDVVRPGASARSQRASFDDDLAHAVGVLGVYGLMLPEPHGAGADLRSLCIAVEEIAAVDSSLAVTVHVQASNTALLATFLEPADERAAEILPKLAAGEQFISFGLTEPTGGSDASQVSTTAQRSSGGWVLNGSKQFITNVGTRTSTYVTVFAATDPEQPRRLSAFLVPVNTPGVTVGPSYPKMGWKSSDTHPLYFDDVHLPDNAILGEEGRGYSRALELLTWARLPLAAMSAGLARDCVRACVRFSKDRRLFGKTLSAHQSAAFSIADMAAMAATCRLLTYDGAWKFDQGQDIRNEAAIAKLVAAELANKVAYKATQMHGGYGFIRETDVTRHYEDARILTIGEGTSEVQRLLIARGLGMSV